MTSTSPPAGAPASAAVDAAVESALGALLRDRDVSDIESLEGGIISVVRRGRRQRLDAILEGELFALLREQGAENHVVRVRLKHGHALVCGPLVDGRLALRIEKAPLLDATLDALVEEGLLPPGVSSELVAAVLEGAGLLVLGPSRAGRQRVVGAVVRALQAHLSFFGVTDGLHGLLPVPAGATVVDKALGALSLGADALCGLDVTGADLGAVVRTSPGVPLVMSVAASSMDALAAALGDLPVVAAAGQSAVVGHAPDGQPRLVELHGPTRAGDEVDSPSASESTSGTAGLLPSIANAGSPREVSGLRERPRAAATVVVDRDEAALPQLGSLPAGWASDAPDDDPGWELAGLPPVSDAPPAPGSFDAALAAQKTRPTFAPRPPSTHPQTATLKSRGLGGDPFGGLTFEPPPGGPPSGDGEDEK